MKTSIFDMTFVLPPLVEMHEVVKDMPAASVWVAFAWVCGEENT